MTKIEPRWVPRLVVESVHLDQIREHGGPLGIRDENAFESAMGRPKQRWNYEPESDLARLAAAYAYGLARNHPFRDGNKRIAFLVAVICLGLKGLDFVAPEDEVVETMLALASGNLGDEQVARWFRDRTEPRS